MRVHFRHGCLSGLLLAACSAAAPHGAHGTSNFVPGSGGAGAVGGPAASGGNSAAQAGNGFGNSTGTLLPPPTSTMTAGSGGSAAGTAMTGLSSRTPVLIDQSGMGNPAGLSPADAATLVTGSGSPGMLKFLYPYANTVFPRGMGAPLLMWSGADMADAVYVHIQSKAFEYKAVLKPTAAGQLALPQDVWNQAGHQTYGKGDHYSLELTTRTGGVVTGPLTQTFEIAQATIKGSIYYNSYNSKLATANGGIVLRIPAGGGATAPVAGAFISTGCNGCHSVSADGSRLISQFVPGGASTFKLVAGGAANPTSAMAGPRGDFGAFYPDGSKFIATSAVIDVARTFMTQSPGAPQDATLYDSDTGMAVTNVGIPKGALMPMLSADGTHLVFNDYAIATAHGLAIMSYDVKTNTASNYKMLMQQTGNLRPGWPFVLPDNNGVIFTMTDSTDFSGNGAGITAAAGGFFGGGAMMNGNAPSSELSIVDVATSTITVLAKAMGYDTPADAASGKTYLPFGTEELKHNYFPTLSPVAAGGYFWLFFDSLRHYGNLGTQRQLWGAAIDIQANGSYALDPSYPPFYLPGQELGTGNHRAFAALDPCKKDGETCNSGIDCCGGTCYFDKPMENIDQVGSCMPKMMMMCSKTDEKCTTDADCCPPTDATQPPNMCIAGFCAQLVLN